MNKTVVLTKAHTHAGRELQPGTLLSIEARVADWLVEQSKAQYQPGVTVVPTGSNGNVRSGCCGGRW